MPNIEIKAQCPDLDKAFEIVHKIKTDYVGNLHQVDTYFETKEGRLKLREIDDAEAQLIPYYKEYSTGPMKSSYSVLPVNDKENLKDILGKILGQVTVVDKQREVFLIDNIRVHLDKVKGLGSFIEFEAVYEENTPKDKEQEVKKVNELMDTFKIEKNNLLDKSYIDYFLNKETMNINDNLHVLYYFSGKSISLVEIKKLDALKAEPPEKKYFWLFIDKEKGEIRHLKFISMNNDDEFQYREFEALKLRFNQSQAEIVDSNSSYALGPRHPMFLSEVEKNKIFNFFR